ncbi:MAG: right-handed parallel beta-helix repeat-containing protein [Planctomycetes bacterium]|nr:right-handed parallel beta-helix repeat-containing protein [Planctomycetota bacterium]
MMSRFLLACTAFLVPAFSASAVDNEQIGLIAPVGPLPGVPPRLVHSLTMSGGKDLQQNLVIDHEWKSRDAVRITGDGSILRNCEIRNGLNDGIEVYAADVLIESCRIHHFLNGTFKNQSDAHGITGRPTRLTVRNCEIFYVSGDCLQFDPDRKTWTGVTIENCELWTGPLPENAATFRKGEVPGENAFDSKTVKSGPRPSVVIRNCVIHGWGYGQIDNGAGLNLKENVDVTVENCVFFDNDICIRARGRGDTADVGSRSTVTDCFFYDSGTGVRAEDAPSLLDIIAPGWGKGLKQQYFATDDKKGAMKVVGGRSIGPMPLLPDGKPAFGWALKSYRAKLSAGSASAGPATVDLTPKQEAPPPAFPEIERALSSNRFDDALAFIAGESPESDPAKQALAALSERARRGSSILAAVVAAPDRIKGQKVAVSFAGSRTKAAVKTAGAAGLTVELMDTPLLVPYSDLAPYTVYLLGKAALDDTPENLALLERFLSDIGKSDAPR